MTKLGADDQPDLAILLAASYRVLVDRLQEAMAADDLAAMRPTYGFVIRAVDAEEPTVGRLAELLEVTKQAASRLADDMEKHGFLERVADPADRRRQRLGLTTKGRRVRKRALGVSEALERDLVEAVGADDAAALRRALLALVTSGGALDDVLAKRARPVW
jgi:DNA-binding MarR family transcriptional regulator